jgi:hypothetical protein
MQHGIYNGCADICDPNRIVGNQCDIETGYVRKTQTRFVSIDTNTKTTFVFVSGLCHFLF